MAQQGLPQPPIHDENFSYQWREWLRRTYVRVSAAGQILWDTIDTTGSNLTDIETRNHNDLQNIQGGTSAQYYHLTSSHKSTLTDGSNADSLHTHAISTYTDNIILNEDDALVTDGDFSVLYTE